MAGGFQRDSLMDIHKMDINNSLIDVQQDLG